MATRKPRRASSSTGNRVRTRPAARPARKKAVARKAPAARESYAPGKRAARHEPETLRLRSIEPTFTVNDLERSLRFYTEVLGFIVGERWADEKGVLRGVMLKAGSCSVGLSQDDWAKGRDREKGVGFRIWCVTAQDIDELAARIKHAGGRLAEEPKDESWGGRRLTVTDPDGFHLSFYKEQ